MNKSFKNVTGICFAMAIVISTSGFVLATTTQESTQTTNSVVETKQKPKIMQLTDEQKADLLAKYKEKLATQVTNGKITQTEADTLYAAAEAGDFSKLHGQRGDQNVKPELTDAQKADLLAKYKERLATQVTNGKITQAEADTLYAAAEAGDFSKLHGQKGDQSVKLELTDAQKADLLAKYKERLATQVTNGKITQAEADTLYAAAEAGDFSKLHAQKGDPSVKPELTDAQKADLLAKYKERLATQVTNGKITQAEADTLYTAAEAGDFSKVFGHDGHGQKGEFKDKTQKVTTETTTE